MCGSPDLIISAQNPRADEIAFVEFERAEAFALARLVRSLTLGDCRCKAVFPRGVDFPLDPFPL